MNCLKTLTIFSSIISLSLADDLSFRCGDDWIGIGDEKCYKVVDKNLTKGEALNACNAVNRASHRSSIVSINSNSEQKYLADYLFRQLDIDQNVWIGAKRIDNNGGALFEWEDGSQVDYDNWADNNPSNDPGSKCVQLNAKNGKWIDRSCDSTGIVICEKLQMWSFPQFINNFYGWRRHIENTNEELFESIKSKDQKIESLEKSLEHMSKMVSTLRSDMTDISFNFNKRLNKTIELISEQNDETENKLSQLEQKTNKIIDGLLALRDECSSGCSNENNDGLTDSQLETIRKEISNGIEAKLRPIDNQLKNTVTDARLAIISYRRTLQIKKKEKWISLGYV